MQLSDTDRTALVRHMCERFTSFADRAAIAQAAAVPDAQITGDVEVAWRSIIDEAVALDRMVPLLRAASRARPDDALLLKLRTGAESETLVVPPADNVRAWLRGAVVAGGVVLLLGLAAFLFDVLATEPTTGGSEPTTGGSEPAVVAQAPAPAAVAPEAAVVVGPAVKTSDAPGEADAAEDIAVRDHGPPVVEQPVPVEPPAPRANPADAAPLCPGPAGTVVGYAYVGSKSPGAAGSAWVLPQSVNVRRSYPTQDNGWNARDTVVCVLPRGATLQIVQAPIPVAGDAFWVPVTAGSASRP